MGLERDLAQEIKEKRTVAFIHCGYEVELMNGQKNLLVAALKKVPLGRVVKGMKEKMKRRSC